MPILHPARCIRYKGGKNEVLSSQVDDASLEESRDLCVDAFEECLRRNNRTRAQAAKVKLHH